MRLNVLPFFLLLLLLLTNLAVHSEQTSTPNVLTTASPSPRYKRLAKYCYIDNYQAWLERQREFLVWMDVAKLLRLPLDEDEEFQREFERFRLQYQCLRLVERLPISIGPG